jgi:ABC-2 type transport system permease protein
MIGRRLIRNLLVLVSYILATAISVYLFAKVEIDFSKILILIGFVPITFVINHFIGCLLGSLAFFMKDRHDFDSMADIWETFKTIIAGFIIPLDKLPFSGFLQFLPTSWLLHRPMQIYLNKYSPLETFYVFLGGLVWCLVLYFLAKWVFKLGLKRNESVGL